MQINNPLHMNDWAIRKFLEVVLAIQLAIWGLIGLEATGVQIPILRQLIGFIYLTFIPGIVILRILKLHQLGTIETILYSVGLSLATLMFTGLFVNVVYPMFGISGPISLWPVIITITIFILILCIISYFQDKNYQPIPKKNLSLHEFLSPPHLFLLLLPLLAALGGMIVTFYQNNLILLALILLIASVPIMVAFNKFIPERAYIFALFMLALALLLHTTMVSLYPMRLNVDWEFFYQNLVAQEGYWDATLPHNVNSALSVVLLIPIYSMLLGINTIWVFKLIYPLIFSLVPLILYHVYDKQIGPKFAFLSVFFYMSMFYFYIEIPLLRRQQVACMYFALLILMLVDRKLTQLQRSVLSIIFAFSLIVSHYAMGYICLFFFVFGYLLLLIIKSNILENLWRRLQRILNGQADAAHKFTNTNPNFRPLLTNSFVILYLVFTLTWYIYSTSGSSFDGVIGISQHIYASIGKFLDPTTKSPLIASAFGGGFFSATILNKIYRIVVYVTQLCIITGFIKILFRPTKFKKEYIIICTIAILLLFIIIVTPFVSIAIHMGRLYFILLFVLSPLCLVGGKTIWDCLLIFYQKVFLWHRKMIKKGHMKLSNPSFRLKTDAFLVFFVLFVLIPYFLFNTGFVFAVGSYTQEDIYNCGVFSSASLSYGKIDTGYHNQQEFVSAKRLAGMISQDSMIYADAYIGADLISAWHGSKTRWFPQDLKKIESTSYVFLRTWNIDKNEIYVITYEGDRRKPEYMSLQDVHGQYDSFGIRSKIYDNGGVVVLGKAIENN